MDHLHHLPNYGLANTVTGFMTLFAGLLPLCFVWLMGRQPRRWQFVYWLIVITGIFTVTLHGFGETNQIWGPRWFWSFLDTGSNIVVTWGMALAVLGDFYSKEIRRWAMPIVTVLMVLGVGWHFYDRLPGAERAYLIPLGGWGGFYPGESWLIAFSWLNVGMFVYNRQHISKAAMPLLWVTVAIFFFGMLLATASNDKIVWPFIPLHALWHLVGAAGFVTLWGFNHVRFVHEADQPQALGSAAA